MRYYRLIGLFEGNKRLPLVVVAQIDPTADTMVTTKVEWTLLDHFEKSTKILGDPKKDVVVIQHYTSKVLAVFTWSQVANAYWIAMTTNFPKPGPQLQKEKDGRNAVSIEEWREGMWVKLAPAEMPGPRCSPSKIHHKLPPIDTAPNVMVLAAEALRMRSR